MSSNSRTFLTILTILISCCSLAHAQSIELPDKSDKSNKVAVIDGKRVITFNEVDDQIAAQLFNLQKQIYELRRNALNNLITRIMLEQEANRLGTSVNELRKSMSSPDSAISQKQIEEAFSETTSLQTGLAEDEMKERLRLDLENQIKIKTFQTRLQELRNRTGVEIYLSEPEPPLIRISDEGPSSGSPSSPVTIVEFSDFQCPFCKRASETVRELARLYDGKVRIVFKHFPLSNHPDAFKAAQASVCADEKGKFWEYHDRLFNSQNLSDESLRKIAADIGLETKEFSACLESSRSKEQVMKNIQEGRKIGIQGTPFFTINGRPVRGAQEISEFRRIIDRQLAGER